MVIEIPTKLYQIIKTLNEGGYDAYIVGGVVRDIISGRQPYDWDLTTNATPDEILKLFTDAYYTNDFGMVGIPDDEGKRPFEITTFRKEHGYSDSRRPDSVTWGKTLEDDLSRRDFTINAIALKSDLKNLGNNSKVSINVEIVDPYGGVENLNNKLLKTVGDPNDRFSEDALRMMRAIRIATEVELQIEENTLLAIRKNSELITKISKERVRDELLKTISSNNPDKGILLLKETNLMHYILPELEVCFGIQQVSPGRHHIYDVGTHLIMSLKYVSEKSKDPIVRLATLLHDIGKAPTFKRLENGVITFYNHEIYGARSIKKISERLRLSRADSDKLWKLVRYHQFTLDEKQTDSSVRRFIRNVGKENISDMLNLRIGDRLGGGARETSWRFEEFKERLIEVQKEPFRVQDLKISGYDIMKMFNLEPGPKVGDILNKIFDDVVKKKVKNDHDALLEFIKKAN